MMRTSSRSGFTLVEIVATLAISVLAIGALVMAFGIGVRVFNRGNIDSEIVEHVGRATSRFSEDVESLMPLRYVAADTVAGGVVFAGNRRSVTFAGMVRTGAYGGTRLRLVNYRLVQGRGGFVLERRTALLPENLASFAEADWKERIPVIEGIRTPGFSFASTGERGNVVWTNGWTAGPGLPLAVRLSFEVYGRPVTIDAPVFADPERDCRLPDMLGCGEQPVPTDNPNPQPVVPL